MKIAHPQSTYGLNLSYGSAGTYSGLDRFGRIIEQKWTLNSGTVLDQETYAYDRNSNMAGAGGLLLAGVNPVLWGGAAADGATAGAATSAAATLELGIGTQAVVAPGLDVPRSIARIAGVVALML